MQKNAHTHREKRGKTSVERESERGHAEMWKKKRMLHVTRFGFAALTTLRKTLTRLAVRETRPGNFANRKQLKRRETEREKNKKQQSKCRKKKEYGK